MFARLWNLIRRPTGYVGKDLQGNYFYEHASTTADPRRTRRVVKYRGQTDTLAVAERSRQLAVQWKAWLTHTRREPPTLEELRADTARLQRLRHNVSLIEARNREEREQRSRLLTFGTNEADSEALHRNNSETSHPSTNARMGDPPRNTNDASLPSTSEHTLKEQQKQKLQEEVKRYARDPWAEQQQQQLSHSSDEPQAWTPRAVQRGA